MCCSFEPAHFSDTIVTAYELSQMGIHVVGYQNRASNLGLGSTLTAKYQFSRGGPPPVTGNAMLLHFPAAEPMTEENMLDTSHATHILKDMVLAVAPRPKMVVSLGSRLIGAARGPALVFEKGNYHVVLAQNAMDIPAALNRVPEERRPEITDRTRAIYMQYDEWFPGWQYALCCFNNSELREADPLLWWYKPMYPRYLHMPALDAHDGNPPDIHTTVLADHWVIVGSDRMKEDLGSPVQYQDEIPDSMSTYLPKRVYGMRMSGEYPNGDFAFPISQLVEGFRNAPFRFTPASWREPQIAAK